MRAKIIGAIAFMLVLIILCFYTMIGPGWFSRITTLSGVYVVVRPDGYDAACFGDSGHRDGGLSCLPCSQINDCKKR